MTNFERWQVLTSRITSPQSWIDFGYFFLIGAALQRRVFYYGSGDDGSELFPNPYYCFIGKPGLGKGLVTGIVARLLRHHKYERGAEIKTSIGSEKPPLFPVGADSVTFEQLLIEISDSIRRIPIPGRDKPYVHSSYAFVLEELDSLFKRKTQDVADFLKNAYDCKPYGYLTKHQGKVQLRNICMSFLAAAQPDFLHEARKNRLFGSGFASRTLFLFEAHKRFSAFHITELSPEQRTCQDELLHWLKQLAGLYGKLTYDQATYNFLESWERDCLRINEEQCSPKMQEYFARKKVTMLKLAAAIHFSDSLGLEMPVAPFVEAVKRLDAIEIHLEHGLNSAGRNELYAYTTRIKNFIIAKKAVSDAEVIIEFSSDMSVEEIRKSLEELETIRVVTVRLEKGRKIYSAK